MPVPYRSMPCPMCGKVTIMNLNPGQVNAWLHGTHIQNAFPELNAQEREVMLTGFCSQECWDKAFAEDEDDD
jgi:hypothetical protein